MSEVAKQTSELHKDVNNLVRAVTALELTLKSDYPTRKEVRHRRVQVTLAMVAAIIASYFTTVATISYCFLQGVPNDGERVICEVFPGYEESFDNNRAFMRQYADLLELVRRNQDEIARLKEQAAEPK